MASEARKGGLRLKKSLPLICCDFHNLFEQRTANSGRRTPRSKHFIPKQNIDFFLRLKAQKRMYSVSELFSVFRLPVFFRFRHNRRHEENKFRVSKGIGADGKTLSWRQNLVDRPRPVCLRQTGWLDVTGRAEKLYPPDAVL